MNVRAQELQEEIMKPYDPVEHPDIAQYITDYQALMTEYEALTAEDTELTVYKDGEQKRLLLRALRDIPSISHYLMTCEDDKSRTFAATCRYLRQHCLKLKYIKKSAKHKAPKATVLNTVQDYVFEEEELELPPKEESPAEVMARINTMCKEAGPINVYNVLRSPMGRKTLSVPDPLWKALQPEMRQEIVKIREQL